MIDDRDRMALRMVSQQFLRWPSKWSVSVFIAGMCVGALVAFPLAAFVVEVGP